jgi:LPS-assembly protein
MMKFNLACMVQMYCLIVFVGAFWGASAVFAATTITANTLEQQKAEGLYIASGNVVIVRDATTYKADKAIYNEQTADMQLSGNVVIEDKGFLIKTEQAEYNAKSQKGMLHNGVIFLKQGKNWVYGKDLQKLGENHYYAKTVYFTACDTEAFRTAKIIKPKKGEPVDKADWCFKGNDANIYAGDKVTAKNVTYRIKDMPVLYSPYFQGPGDNDRKTGLLMPQIGSSSQKGFMFRPAFFWAIDENRDATLSADYYSKRGVGAGLEYRFVEPNHRGNWYAYQLYDTKLSERFVVLRASDRYTTPGLQAFLDINYVNRWNYYNEYGDAFQMTVSRYLQSSAEVSVPINTPNTSSRAYLLSQYWVNLRGDLTESVPQKLPEVGYVLNPTPVGPGMLSVSASAANFMRNLDITNSLKNFDPYGQRFDFMPTVSYSMGDAVRLTQTATFRETAYNLSNEGSYGQNPHREMFQYRAQLQTRVMKNYGAFMHVMEPSVEYNYIPFAKSLPLFDSTELPVKESVVQAAILNRFIFKGLTVSFRLIQPYDTFANGSDGVMPTSLQGYISGPQLPVSLSMLASYDSRNRRIDTVNSNIGIKIFKDVTLGLGELYSHMDGMMYLTQSFSAELSKHWVLTEATSYDARAAYKLRDVAIGLTYREQCWNLKTIFTRRPSDGIKGAEYTFVVFIDLRGFGVFRLN